MYLKIVCAWCGKFIGIKEGGNGTKEISHSICCECARKVEKDAEAFLKSNKIKELERR